MVSEKAVQERQPDSVAFGSLEPIEHQGQTEDKED